MHAGTVSHFHSARKEVLSPLRQAYPTVLFPTDELSLPPPRLTQPEHPQTWLEMPLLPSRYQAQPSLRRPHHGRSQAEIRVQTLSKALRPKAEICPARGPEGRQRHPHQGLCPGFPLPPEVAPEPGHFSVSSFLCTKQPHHQGNTPHQGSSGPTASAAASPLPSSLRRGTEKCICPRQPETLHTCTSEGFPSSSCPTAIMGRAWHCRDLSRCFQSPALCDTGKLEPSLPALPHMLLSSAITSRVPAPSSRIQLPCRGTQPPPLLKCLYVDSEQSPSKRRPAGDTRLSRACPM